MFWPEEKFPLIADGGQQTTVIQAKMNRDVAFKVLWQTKGLRPVIEIYCGDMLTNKQKAAVRPTF